MSENKHQKQPFNEAIQSNFQLILPITLMFLFSILNKTLDECISRAMNAKYVLGDIAIGLSLHKWIFT